MISTVDQLLLNGDQQTAMKRVKQAWQSYQQQGDVAGMQAAHQQAEAIRAAAGYSGGETGSEYRLLETANAPAGYGAYEKLVQNYAGGGMNAIATGYAAQLAELERQRNEILAREEQDQSAARSAVWNTQRLAADGLLTRGLSNTGIADVITATALNQASANAYQALLNRRAALDENTVAKAEAEAAARSDAAALQVELGTLLGDAYASFYEQEADLAESAADRALTYQLRQMKDQADLNEAEQDYYYQLALAQLKRQWEVEDLKQEW